jgi:hypothetical protein
MKRITPEQQRENIAVAYSIIGGIPPEQFNLDTFCNSYKVQKPEDIEVASKHRCGTIGCTLGWLAIHPYFTAQGLGLRNGSVIDTADNPHGYGYGYGTDVELIAQRLFGRRAFNRFFDAYGDGAADKFLLKELNQPKDYGSGTQQEHKALALARLKRGYYSKFNSKLEVPK